MRLYIELETEAGPQQIARTLGYLGEAIINREAEHGDAFDRKAVATYDSIDPAGVTLVSISVN